MVIFFDIDGTLIDETQNMPASAREAIRDAKENGHICMINTGRAANMVSEDLRRMAGMDGYLFGCGTMIEYRGEILYHKTFTVPEAEDIIEGLRRYQIDAVLEGVSHTFCPYPEETFSVEFRRFSEKWLQDGYQCSTWEKAAGHFDKFYSYMGDKKKRDGFMEEFGDRLDFIDREKGYYEVTPRGFSKASGMERMAGILQFTMKDTVAIGDSNNDLSMLKCAGRAVAMAKSSAEVLKTADFITTDVNNDGIRNALKWLGAI